MMLAELFPEVSKMTNFRNNLPPNFFIKTEFMRPHLRIPCCTHFRTDLRNDSVYFDVIVKSATAVTNNRTENARRHKFFIPKLSHVMHKLRPTSIFSQTTLVFITPDPRFMLFATISG